MISTPFEISQYSENNPLDMVEDIAEEKEWQFSRSDDDRMKIVIDGLKSKIEVNIEWQEEYAAILLACSMPITITEENYEITAQAIEKINSSLWLGHFELMGDDMLPSFRHTLLLRAIPASLSSSMIEDVINIAISECDRFYTSFKLAQAGDILLHDGLNAVTFETVGEA